MTDVIKEIYAPMLRAYGFEEAPGCRRFSPMGTCWSHPEGGMNGYYWTYGQKELFDIRIHDFYFEEDSFLHFEMHECLSVSWYESISGEEFSPYRRLNAGCVKSFIGGQKPYEVLIHKDVPLRCTGIEITPAYYRDYLRACYPEVESDPLAAFAQLDQTENFPEMVRLLREVRDYRGEGMAAKLFYEGKVAEAVGMVIERGRQAPPPAHTVAPEDVRALADVAAYINDHYAMTLPLERLAKIACMGGTKLKASFRQVYGCTITTYIQERRMSQAEQLLTRTGLSVGQVAGIVGYRNQSRFAELFRKSTGVQPAAYRKQVQERE